MPRPTNMKTKTRFGVLICNQLSKMGKNQKRSCSRIWSLTVLCERDS